MSGPNAAHPDPEPISSNTGHVFNGFLDLPKWRPTGERAVWDFLQGLCRMKIHHVYIFLMHVIDLITNN